MIKLPQWSRPLILKEAGVHGIRLARLNGFPELTDDEVELVSKLVFKRVDKIHRDDKIKSKKKLKTLFNSIDFDKIVYEELLTVYELV